MNHHTSLETQQANAKQSDFIRCMASLDLYGFKLVGIRREDSVILAQSGDWTVEVDQDGLVKNQGSDKSPADFATWQLQNQGRLLGWDDETPDFETTTIPCDCGNPNAVWRGDKQGRRMYVCDECAKHFPELK